MDDEKTKALDAAIVPPKGVVEPTGLARPSDIMPLARARDAAPPAPREILALAVQHGADPDTLEKLLALQERWEANEAKKLYVKSMATFKQRAPAVLHKDAVVDFKAGNSRVHYKHTSLGNAVEQTAALLGEHGLSAAWSTGQTDRLITVTCHITHEAGHSEHVTLSAPPDATGNKNPIQQVCSTVTYLERYTLLAALGLATAEQDDDGRAAGGEASANEQQVFKIQELCHGLGIGRDDWAPAALNLFPAGVRRLRDMTEAQAATLITRLTQAKIKGDLAPATGPAHDPLLGNAGGQEEATAATEASEADEDRDMLTELGPFMDGLNNKDEKAALAACGIVGDWRGADDETLNKLLGIMYDKANS